jgi:hypothetical protein
LAIGSAQLLFIQLEGADLARGVLLQVQSPQGGTNFVMLKAEG